MLRETLAKLLELPASERADIAMALWDSLTPAEQEAEFDLTLEQRAELDRRLAEHIADPASAIPWDEVRRKLRRGARRHVLFSAPKQRQSYSTPVTGTRNSALGLVEPLRRKPTCVVPVSPRPLSRTLAPQAR